MQTYYKQHAMLITRIASCQCKASAALHDASQLVSVGDLNQAQVAIRRAEADVGRALQWQRTMERATDKHKV